MTKGSKLVPIGALLMLLAISSGFVARALGPTPSMFAALLVDGLRLCFWLGLIFLALGLARKRRSKSRSA
jgi:hypothetical protein